jgi:Leucine-rich repeat (LRR) protein
VEIDTGLSGDMPGPDSTVLFPPATLRGVVHPAAFDKAGSIYAFVNGTDIFGRVDHTGAFELAAVPRTEKLDISLVAFAADTLVQSRMSVAVNATETTLPDTIIVSPDFVSDTLAIREILDANGLRAQAIAPLIATRNSRVVSLSLRDLGIGTLASSIGKLDSLRALDLSHNNLADLPDSLTHCTGIERLWLGYNEFTAFPPVLWQLRSLRWLELGHNFINDSIPADIASLALLDTVYFSYNRIPGISGEIGRLTGLRSLTLDYNDLVELPDSLVRCSGLKKLMLNHCRLKKLPSELGRLSSLEYLLVEHNGLDSLPGSLRQLPNLKRLQIAGNNITSLPLTVEQLNNLEAERSDFIDNPYCELPDSIDVWLGENAEIYDGDKPCGP